MSSIVGSIVAKLVLDIKDFSSNLSLAQSELKKSQEELEGFTTLGKQFSSVGKDMTKYITLPIAGIGTASAIASANFEQSMSKVQAISGATAEDMDRLNEKALEMGEKTKFSAKESADAFTYMAMAGWKTEDMLQGIDGIMNLAAADGLDLATTSDIVTDALTAFGLQAKDSSHFADVLAVASSSANTNVEMMGESFKYVAPVAGSLGYSIEDTAVALGIMANSGIKASQAGTSLRAALTRMIDPTDEAESIMQKYGITLTNADGSMKSLGEVMVQLRSKLGGLSEAEQAQAASALFGQEAMSGMLAIINASDTDFNTLTNSINNADGAAQEMAEVMMDNTAGAIEQMRGSLETLAISIGDILSPIIRACADVIRSFADWLNGLDSTTKSIIVTVGLFVAALGPVLIVIGKIMTGVTGLITFFEYAGPVFSKLGSIASAAFGLMKTAALGAFSAIMAHPIIAGITAIIAIIVLLYQNCEWFRDGVNEILSWLGEKFNEFVTFFVEKGEDVINWFKELPGNIANFVANIPNMLFSLGTQMIDSIISGISDMFGSLGDIVDEIVDTIIDGISSLPGKLFDMGANMLSGLWEGFKSGIDGLWNNVTGWGSSFIGGIANFFGIHSPSTVFRDFIGRNLFAGLGESFKKYTNLVFDPMKKFNNDLYNSFVSDFDNIGFRGLYSTDTNELSNYLDKNRTLSSDAPRQSGGGSNRGENVYGDTNINLNIEHFYNESDKDIRQLTKEVMEVAEEENKRKRGVFGNEATA